MTRSALDSTIAGFINPTPYIKTVQSIQKYRLSVAFNFSSNAGGFLSASLATNPASFPEFNLLTALYAEYRVLGGKVTVGTSGVGAIGGTCMIVYDPVDATALASPADALPYFSRDIFSLYSTDKVPYQYTFKYPSGGANTAIEWGLSTSGAWPGAIKFIAPSLVTPNASYLAGIMDLYIEFRNRA